jgi:hypothetical protein
MLIIRWGESVDSFSFESVDSFSFHFPFSLNIYSMISSWPWGLAFHGMLQVYSYLVPNVFSQRRKFFIQSLFLLSKVFSLESKRFLYISIFSRLIPLVWENALIKTISMAHQVSSQLWRQRDQGMWTLFRFRTFSDQNVNVLWSEHEDSGAFQSELYNLCYQFL